MNTKATVTSLLGSLARLTALGACLALAACGGAENWSQSAPYVKVGGTIKGLTGKLVLHNNGGNDTLTATADGLFTFPLQIAAGHAYAISIGSQPVGELCLVANGTGTANKDVYTIEVTCHRDVTIGGTVAGLAGTLLLQNNGGDTLATASNGAFTFSKSVQYGSAYAVSVLTAPSGLDCAVSNAAGTATADVVAVSVVCGAIVLRPLPAAYTTGKAINYSAYRGAGPDFGEVLVNANIDQDLDLLHAAGYTLLRLFASDSGGVIIARAALKPYPMAFHLGLYLEGAPASCVDAVNSSQISQAIAVANQYKAGAAGAGSATVVSVSVGNETSFAANLPVSCLASYIRTVRAAVTQPVTADDDYTFYAGLTSGGEKPDSILPLLDFVSIHMYPMSYIFDPRGSWNWQQTGVTAGPLRAKAMMDASLVAAKAAYDKVASYLYSRNGTTTSVGASLPIVIGETGWKTFQSNPSSPIETYAANPVNAKMYFDELYGFAKTGLSSWQGAANGPVTIFYFEAFDEAWKAQNGHTDDGWGLWDKNRVARYALCDVPGFAACNGTVYQGAGYSP